jgi:hypothetical protein
MNPPLGAVVIGVKIKRLSASLIDAKLFAHVNIELDVALTRQPI